MYIDMSMGTRATLRCRPYVELVNIPKREWTKEEMSAFSGYSPREYTKIYNEWERACNRINKHRRIKVM